MDIMIVMFSEEAISFVAMSPRAIALFEERNGDGVNQFVCTKNPANVFAKFPKDFTFEMEMPDKKDVH